MPPVPQAPLGVIHRELLRSFVLDFILAPQFRKLHWGLFTENSYGVLILISFIPPVPQAPLGVIHRELLRIFVLDFIHAPSSAGSTGGYSQRTPTEFCS